jgi:hypothetical protein
MTLGQILFELRATQKRTDGRTDGWTDKGKSKCPPLKWGHKNSSVLSKPMTFSKYLMGMNIKILLVAHPLNKLRIKMKSEKLWKPYFHAHNLT